MKPLTRSDEVGSGPYDSIAWAFETHVKQPDVGIYNFALLHGNEDCPNRIDFFVSDNPDYNAEPEYVWSDKLSMILRQAMEGKGSE